MNDKDTTTVRVARLSRDCIRVSFHCPPANGVLDVHHWDLTEERAREFAVALMTSARCGACCNPECGGNWGTGCFCCHFNHRDGEVRAILMAP